MNLLKKRWLNWNLRRSKKGDTRSMDRLYRIRDPWNLDVPSEHVRFQETSRLIRACLGEHFSSILEIGCGEGLQTQYLAPLAERITGIDPGLHAIERANARQIPNAVFEVGELMTYPPKAKEVFDLVTACEVLYYLEDFERAFQNLNALGRACVVTYYSGMYERLDPFFKTKQVQFETLTNSLGEWRAVWWRVQSQAH